MKGQDSGLRSIAGFTLIELSLAITLLALLAVVLYGAFSLGHRATERVQARFEDSQRIRSVGDFLGGYIRSIYPYRPTPRDPSIFFSGEEEQLVFVSSISMVAGNRGMAKIRVSKEPHEGEGASLELEEEIPVRMEGQVDSNGLRKSLVLWRGVDALRIEYLDPRSEEEHWLERWDGEERRALPRAVRFDLRVNGGEEVHWVFPIMMRVLGPR